MCRWGREAMYSFSGGHLGHRWGHICHVDNLQRSDRPTGGNECGYCKNGHDRDDLSERERWCDEMLTRGIRWICLTLWFVELDHNWSQGLFLWHVKWETGVMEFTGPFCDLFYIHCLDTFQLYRILNQSNLAGKVIMGYEHIKIWSQFHHMTRVVWHACMVTRVPVTRFQPVIQL